MKRTKILALVVVALMVFSLMTSCTPAPEDNSPGSVESPKTPAPPTGTPTPTELETLGLDENYRFLETRYITCEVYDRANEGGTKPDDNFYTDYIKEKLLEKHNIVVEYVTVPRWTEGTDIANLMAAGTAPDIGVTYSFGTINTYGTMGGVIDLYPYLTDYGYLFSNLYELLGTTNIFWDLDPVDNHLWAIEGIRQENFSSVTFIREDWLNKLNLPEPTTLQEFEDCLVAFRDNAELLLGADAGRIIPLMQTHDVRWGMRNVVDGFLPNDLTDKDRYIYGTLEGFVLHPYAGKEATRTFNKWYNMGLTWKDFSLYDSSNLGEVATDLIKSGYVGAWMGDHDGLYRNGDKSTQYVMQQTVGEDAAFIGLNLFPNDSGEVGHMVSAPTDRKIFLPSTNDEPLASLLYIDFISSLEIYKFLQIGEEGVTHEVEPDGAVRVISTSGEKIMNSLRNIDYTLTINGLDLGDDELTKKSMALGYANIDPFYVQRAIDMGGNYQRIGKAVNVGTIEAEVGIMDELNSKRDVLLINAIVAKPENFDAVWDELMTDLLNSGAQAILDERTAKWEQFFGDKLFLD